MGFFDFEWMERSEWSIIVRVTECGTEEERESGSCVFLFLGTLLCFSKVGHWMKTKTREKRKKLNGCRGGQLIFVMNNGASLSLASPAIIFICTEFCFSYFNVVKRFRGSFTCSNQLPTPQKNHEKKHDTTSILFCLFKV